MKTYLRKEAMRHGSSLQITNKKIEHDMALFFKDNTIRNFDKESINMTSKDVEEPKANGKNKDAERSAARA